MEMKAKYFILTTVAEAVFAGCTRDAYVGYDEPYKPVADSVAIGLGSSACAMTRVSAEEAASLLGNKFFVYGTKTKEGSTTAVFDNYVVEFKADADASADIDALGWEYAGKVSNKGVTQEVKYWDTEADHYTFVAVAGPAAGDITMDTTDGIRINVADNGDMNDIYVADRITATAADHITDSEASANSLYKDIVQFQFHKLGAQMRIGFYETVTGYAVKDLIFHIEGASAAKRELCVVATFPHSGSYDISYDDTTNSVIVGFSANGNDMEDSGSFGMLDYTYANTHEGNPSKPYLNTDGTATSTPVMAFLGTSSTEAVYGTGAFAGGGNQGKTSTYKPILPYEDNSQEMRLCVDYTLVALDGSCDSITVHDATVSVPGNFLKWRPNYAYTYLFKISENRENGETTITHSPRRDTTRQGSLQEITVHGSRQGATTQGSKVSGSENPADRFPITFDAMMVEAEDNTTAVYTADNRANKPYGAHGANGTYGTHGAYGAYQSQD